MQIQLQKSNVHSSLAAPACAICHLPFFYDGLRHVPPRCLVLANAAEAISRASCPPQYRPLIPNLYSLISNVQSLFLSLLITRHALRVTVFLLRQVPSRCLVLANAAEVISRASCPPQYRPLIPNL